MYIIVVRHRTELLTLLQHVPPSQLFLPNTLRMSGCVAIALHIRSVSLRIVIVSFHHLIVQ